MTFKRMLYLKVNTLIFIPYAPLVISVLARCKIHQPGSAACAFGGMPHRPRAPGACVIVEEKVSPHTADFIPGCNGMGGRLISKVLRLGTFVLE